jgi:hypothetical protein
MSPTPTPKSNDIPGDEVKRFPESAWRGAFAKYRSLVGPTSEAPDEFAWGSLAASLSFLSGRSATLPWGPTTMPPVLNVGLLGPTARGRKSTPIEDAAEIVITPLMRKAQRPEPPPMEIVVGLGSGEGFAEAIADRKWWRPGTKPGKDEPEVQIGRSGLFVVHELGALLGKVRRDQAGAMVDFILAAFDARRIWTHRTRARSDSPALTMTNAIAVFLCASTKEWLAKTLSDTLVMAGLPNRFLWLTGERKTPIACRPPIDLTAINQFREEVRECISSVATKNFVLDPDATAEHTRRYGDEYQRKTESEIAAASTARNDVLALRVAMVLAIADGTPSISVDHIKAAWEVADYSRTVIEGLVARIEEQSLREAEGRVLAAATKSADANGGTFTQRDVRQRVKGRTGMPAETFLRIWDATVAAGDIQADGAKDRFMLGDRSASK